MMTEQQAEVVFTERVQDVKTLFKKTGKPPVLVIQQYPVSDEHAIRIPYIRESVTNLLAFVELSSVSFLETVIRLSGGVFSAVVFDIDRKRENSEQLIDAIKKDWPGSGLFMYSDNQTWADAAIQLIQRLHGDIRGMNVLLTGTGSLHEILHWKLTQWGVQTSALPVANQQYDIVVGGGIRTTTLLQLDRMNIHAGTTFFDVGIGNFSTEVLQTARNMNCGIYRVDVRAGLSSLVMHLLETDDLVKHVMGAGTMQGIDVVAGGTMGKDGAIILDNINQPSAIIGVADGRGNVRTPREEEADKIRLIKKLLSQQP